MPVAVDGYVVVALVLWMSPVPATVANFAKHNTYGAAGIGILAQSAYHLLFIMSTDRAVWRVVLAAIVGALPPTFAGLAVHMRALIRRESTNTNNTGPSTVDETVPTADPQPTTPAAPDPTPAPVPEVTPEPTPVPADPDIPTPNQVAARITPPPSILRPVPAHRPGPDARPTPTRPNTPTTTPAQLAPPATDMHVTEPGAAQLALPIVSPALLTRARDVARQYRTEHGTPIPRGTLAVRLQVSSEQAAQLLAAMESNRTEPVPTVNGRRTEATR
ncbi:hypothetical protein [Rugosimonospora africana]|uniref:DUF2637 domain-containing protein n=1 Tax=Rugosimonospora africana TaxID=556532 RepID=A0A8J3VU65_9ACTN|nr:hypothetical protein [Rugosimonospora africana]GIH19167.1 hypothetical protein Raf01_73390 [Rugosimonospora africana]